MLSLTLIRRILPRRSLVLVVERRSSPVGRWYMPPLSGWAPSTPLFAVAIAAVTVAPVPVRPEPLAVICDTFLPPARGGRRCSRPRCWRRVGARLDVVGADVRQRLEGGVDLAPVALYGIGAVVWPSKVSVNVPPVALVARTVCCSSVSSSSNGPKPLAVDAAGRRIVTRDHPQVAGLVEVDVARDVAALLAVVVDPQDLLLGGEVQARSPSRPRRT